MCKKKTRARLVLHDFVQEIPAEKRGFPGMFCENIGQLANELSMENKALLKEREIEIPYEPNAYLSFKGDE